MTASFGFEISIFLFAAFIGYILAIRVGQSAVLGMIFIGILLGPTLLGIVSYDNNIQLLAEMGAIFLLFVAGLESNFKDIYSVKNGLIAFMGVLVPFLGGFAFSKLFGLGDVESLFIGTALTATSIAITVHVLKELGKLGSETARTIIGAAVIDDILGLLLLAAATSAGNGTFSFEKILAFAISAILFLMIIVLIMPFISQIIFEVNQWAESTGHFQITILLAMAIAFVYSAAAEFIGLSAIVGAFIAGVTLENLNIKSYREGAMYLEMIFSAIFFVSLGILVNLKEVNPGLLFFILGLTAVAIITKIIGCFIPALLHGLRPRSALIVGIGMVPRGEVAMIVALFGVTAGIISQGIYASILVMALATTVIVPIMLKSLYAHAS